MEVRVRAAGESGTSAGAIQQPEACIKSEETCAIQVTNSSFHYANESVKIHAISKSSMVRLQPAEWRLLKGAVWVEQGAVEIKTVYADLKAQQGQYWVLNQDERILVRNIDSDLQVTLRDGKVLDVPQGFEFWVGGLDSRGQASFGMIHPIDMKAHLSLWNSLYRGTKKDFLKEVALLREAWGDLNVKSATIYQTLAERSIAAADAEEKAVRERKARQAEQARRLKMMYYQRVFER